MKAHGFEPADWRELDRSPFRLFAEDWTLITAGDGAGWNTMTASWGGFGQLWNRDVAFIFVRPSRHTFGFIEGNEGFSLSFFGPGMRKALEVCGSVSGRDTDKAAAAGITPILLSAGGKGWTAFAEARLVLACTKVYFQDIDPGKFADPAIAKNYPSNSDYHRLYIGAIEAAWERH